VLAHNVPVLAPAGEPNRVRNTPACTYDVNGEPTQDLSNLMSAGSAGTDLSHTWNDTYTPVGQLTQVSDGGTSAAGSRARPQAGCGTPKSPPPKSPPPEAPSAGE
jgi:hypothetical protein